MMSESIAVAFNSMVAQNDFEFALELISVISDEVPPPSVVNSIIFNILMENCEEHITNEANIYLNDYLDVLSTKHTSFQYDYRAVLQDESQVFGDIWSSFSHLVESSFSHYNISSTKEKSCSLQLVKYPNCDILIDFYTKMLTKFMSVENDFFEDDSQERFSILLGWINKVYKLTDLRITFLAALHTLLEKKMKYDLGDVISCNASSKNIHGIINLILEKCPDGFNSALNMKGFFAMSNLPYLPAKICQHKLYDLIYKKKLCRKNETSLTLKTILYNYFFYNGQNAENKKKTSASSVLGNNSLRRTRSIRKRIFSKESKGDTLLHKMCRKDKLGDLCELVTQQSCLQLNARNSAGRTPLHEACLSSSYFCVQILLETLTKAGDKVDLMATDKDGLTPLHCAVYADSVVIVQMLLKEGAQLVKLCDKFGEKPSKYATSKNMKSLLEDFESINSDSSSDSSSEIKESQLTVPVMKDKEEYSIFLFGLFTILSHYLKSFNLYDIKKDGVDKLSHSHRKCPHYVSHASTAFCDEDATVFESLPQILECFFACVEKAAKAIDVNVRLGLLPLIVLSKRLAS